MDAKSCVHSGSPSISYRMCVLGGGEGCYLDERLFAKYVSNMTNQDFIPIKVVRGILEPKSYHFPYREITQGKCLILRFLSLDKQI